MDTTFRPEQVPTWAKAAAWAVPLTTIPSIVWRLVTVIHGLVSGDNPCIDPAGPLPGNLYILVILPTVQLGTALLTLGLVRPWGEMFPRWLPALGGRRVPVTLGVGAAAAGAVLVLAFVGFGALGDAQAMRDFWAELGYQMPPSPPGCEPPGWDVLRWYLPMALWPPLLLAVTGHYWRRRRAAKALSRTE